MFSEELAGVPNEALLLYLLSIREECLRREIERLLTISNLVICSEE